MDYRERARLNQDKSIRIKHMAFAVKSVDEALVNYQSLLSVSEKTEKVIWEKGFVSGIETPTLGLFFSTSLISYLLLRRRQSR